MIREGQIFVDSGDMPHAKKYYKPDPNAPERKRQYKAQLKQRKMKNIAVLDMETDPFDAETVTD